MIISPISEVHLSVFCVFMHLQNDYQFIAFYIFFLINNREMQNWERFEDGNYT